MRPTREPRKPKLQYLVGILTIVGLAALSTWMLGNTPRPTVIENEAVRRAIDAIDLASNPFEGASQPRVSPDVVPSIWKGDASQSRPRLRPFARLDLGVAIAGLLTFSVILGAARIRARLRRVSTGVASAQPSPGSSVNATTERCEPALEGTGAARVGPQSLTARSDGASRGGVGTKGPILECTLSRPFESESERDATVGDVDCLSDYRPPQYEVLVQLVGHVECQGREISGLALEVLAILACFRTRSILNSDLVRNTLNRDDNPGTVPNNLSRLRKLLGTSTDGAELLTRATGGRYTDGAFELSPLVVTDIDLLKHRYDAAYELNSLDAIDILRGGLPLLRGPMFRARRGYDWATPEGVLVQAQTAILEYCTRLAHLAADAGDLALVYEAVCLAGNAVDDPIVELSIRQVEQHYADLTGDASLIASARAAQQRFNQALGVPQRSDTDTSG
jgi:hypothetical protein